MERISGGGERMTVCEERLIRWEREGGERNKEKKEGEGGRKR